MPSRARQQGFTLLEVLVAFVILMLAFSVLMRIFATGSRGLVAADDTNRAVAWAQADIAAAGADWPLRVGKGRRELADGFSLERTVEEWPTPESEVSLRTPPLFRVTSRVTWERRGRSREISLTGLHLGPVPERAGGLAR